MKDRASPRRLSPNSVDNHVENLRLSRRKGLIAIPQFSPYELLTRNDSAIYYENVPANVPGNVPGNVPDKIGEINVD